MVLATRMPSVPLGELLAAPVVPRPTKASRSLAEYLSRQLAILHGFARGNLDDAGDASRTTTVDGERLCAATGRLRAALSTLRPLLAHDRVDPLRAELGWLAGALESLRDNEMTARQLRATIAAEPADRIDPLTRSRLREGLDAAAAEARGRLAIALDAPRFAGLLDSLDALAATLPRDLATRAVLNRIRATLRRADDRLDQSTMDTAASVDRAARAYRRARYAVELARPLSPGRYGRLNRRLSTVETLLDRQRAAVLTEQLLLTHASAATEAGEDGFSLGLLLGRQQTGAAPGLLRAGRRVRRAIPSPLRGARAA